MIDPSIIEADLRPDEGWRADVYHDPRGFRTILYGHNLDASGLCQAAGDAQLHFDLNRTLVALSAHLPWWTSQPEAVQRVLANLAFNMGVGELLTFTTFLGLLQAEKYADAATDLLGTAYAKEVGARAVRLAALLRAVTT